MSNQNSYTLKLRRSIFGVIVLVSVLVISTYLVSKTNQRTPNFRILSLQTLYPEAKIIATNWQSDAYLHSADFNVVHESSRTPLSAFFTFLSENTNTWLLIKVFKENESIQVETFTGENSQAFSDSELLLYRPPIDIEYVLLDSSDAFVLLFESGGYEFVNLDNSDFLTFLYLSIQPQGEYPTWRLSRVSEKGNELPSIKINAITNEIIQQ